VFDPATGKTIRVNDLTAGKYDYYVKSGPSYSSQREEASEIYGEFVQRFPDLMGVAGDLIFKASDLPYSDEIAKRMQTLLPPPIQQQLAEGKDIPPEAQAAMAQANQTMQQVQQLGQMVQQAAGENEKLKAEAEKAIAGLNTQKAEFEAFVAKELAGIEKAKADLMMREAQSVAGQAGQDAQNDRQSLASEVQQAVAQIEERAAQHYQRAIDTLAQIMAKQQTQVVVPPPSRPKRIRASRVNGELIAVPEYEDAAPTGAPQGV
jgi:hypothetical protein